MGRQTSASYLMAFTAGALLLRESVVAAEVCARLGDWRVVRKKMLDENLLQIRTGQLLDA